MPGSRFIPTHVGNATLVTSSAIAMSRFIPTHVGNACLPDPPPRAGAVHPHARGERTVPSARTSSAVGSSPRTWGTPHTLKAAGVDCRFIPTHVGNAA